MPFYIGVFVANKYKLKDDAFNAIFDISLIEICEKIELFPTKFQITGAFPIFCKV